MFSKYTKVVILSGLLAIILTLSLQLAKTGQINPASEVCELNAASCEFLIENQVIRLTFEPFPVQLEEEIQLKAHLPSGWQLQSGAIEGVNMYMGLIPLITDGQNSGVFFLGSCSEARMQWQLLLEISTQNGTRYPLVVHFITER